MASGAGSHGDQRFGLTARAAYGMSKAARLAVTSIIAAELADTPVITNAVDPNSPRPGPEPSK